MIADYFAIACGGALGALARHLFGMLLATPAVALPWHTLAVNIVGSLILGYVARSNRFGRRQALFVIVGFLASFTTFSTLAFELVQSIDQGQTSAAALYAAVTMCSGLTAAWLGSEIAIRSLRRGGDTQC